MEVLSLLRRRRDPGHAAQAVDDLYRSILLHTEVEPLRASALARLAEIAGVERAALLLAVPGGFALVAERGGWPEAVQLGDDGLARWLAINERPLPVSRSPEIVADLPAAEARLLAETGVRLVVPLQAAGRLTGMLLLGSGPGDSDPAERAELLASLAVPTALALEHADLVRAQAEGVRRLHRAEQLATAGTLAAGLAHEIRNPLTAIRSGIQMVRAGADDGSDDAEVLDDVLHEVDRINRLVEGLLLLTRAPRPAAGPVDLAEVGRRAVALVEPQARAAGISLGLEAHGPLAVHGDAGQLEQVILNLVLNAIEAVAGGSSDRAVMVSLAEEGRRAVVEVIDSGPGLPSELGDRVLEPFVTTKPDGSGLGLSISETITRRHGGELVLAARPQGGTVVRVLLPRA